MKKLIALALAVSFASPLLVPATADAASLSLAQRRQVLFLRLRLQRLPDGNSNPAQVRRITLRLTRLSPGRAGAWSVRARPKFSDTPEGQEARAALNDAIRTVVNNSPLPESTKESVDKTVNDNLGTPTPTPTPYQA